MLKILDCHSQTRSVKPSLQRLGILSLILGLTLLSFGGLCTAQERDFIDITGTHEIRGTFLKMDGKVVLIKENTGKIRRIKLKLLSIKDQEYLRRMVVGPEVAKESSVTAEQSELAKQAKTILKETCYSCHGEDGSNEGGFNFVLHRERMVDGDQYIQPGSAEDSHLFERVISGEMPEPSVEPRPSEADIEVLRQWIDAGAPEFDSKPKAEFIYPDQVEQLVNKDLRTFAERDRKFQRYFSLVHLRNAGVSEDELETYRLALSKLVNSLSWNPQLMKPESIEPTRTLLRVDLRKLNWSLEIWDSVIARYPYGYVTDSKLLEWFDENCKTELPIVRADWFVSIASKPPMYHEILQVPATDQQLESLLRINVRNNIAQDKVVRVGFNRSGVSQHNRMIERHETPYGSYWKSYDFGGSAGRQNLFQYPMGPGNDEKDFAHDGGEMIFSLPNGLQGYMLTDENGDRLDAGPTSIVSDPGRPDKTVVNGVSCMSCHYAGMIEKNDQIRQHVTTNRKSFPDAEEILALYPIQPQLEQHYKTDANRFADALYAMGIKRITKSGEPVSNMARRFESELDLKMACSEFGISERQFRRHLDAAPELARLLGQLTIPGGSMKRDAYVQCFIEAVKEFKLGSSIFKGDLPTTITQPSFGGGGSAGNGQFAAVIAKLNSGKTWDVRDGLKMLRTIKPNRRVDSIIAALRNIVASGNFVNQRTAIELLGEMDPKGSFNTITSGLHDHSTRSTAMNVLVRMNSKEAAKAIANELHNDSNRREAVKALGRMGALAEQPLLDFLPQASGWTDGKPVVEALGRVGTEKSLKVLRQLSRSPEPFIPDAARRSMEQIKARLKN